MLAGDTIGLRIVGRLENDVVNGQDYRGNAYAVVQRNCFSCNHSATHPLTQADLGKMAAVEDEQTIAKTSTNSVKAGVFLGFGPDDLPIIDTRPAVLG